MDLISRNWLIEALESSGIADSEEDGWVHSFVMNMIADAPTVEAKPVVHCKDCEHWGTGVAGETEHIKCCEYGRYMVSENGYCCYADVRKKVE